MIKNKIFLALVAALFSSIPALAATDSPTDTSSNNLLNLIYYPHLNHLLANANYASDFHATSGDQTISGGEFSLEATYGLLIDGLRVSVSESSLNAARNTSQESYISSGVTDPSFYLNYRLLDSTPGGWSVDAQLGTSPSLGTDELTDPGYPGSAYKGYGNVSLSAAVFWDVGLNEVKISGEIFRDFSGNADDAEDSDFSYTRASQWNGNFAITDRIHLTSNAFVEAEATFDLASTTDYAYSNGDSAESTTPFHVTPKLEFGYLPFKQLLLYASMSYDSETSSTNYSNDTSVTSLYRSTSWVMGASLEF
jgi:hypothetical protein